jgi:hypothetical protein
MLFIGKKRVFGTGVKRYRQLTVHRDVGMRMPARAPVIGSGDRRDPRITRQDPRQRQLGRRALFGRGEPAQPRP